MSLGSAAVAAEAPTEEVTIASAMAPDPAKYPYVLRGRSWPITTAHPDAQKWFDHGLDWLYGFCQEEALRCFQHAVDLDRSCAMALWGLASASGPHYNFGWAAYSPALRSVVVRKTGEYAAAAQRACAASKQSAHATTAIEDALIDALQARFPQSTEPAQEEDYVQWTENYADAMQTVYEQFGHDDTDVVVLYAEAMLLLAPWKLWDVSTGEPGPAPARTLRVKAVLERALATAKGAQHPGILHLYIHLMEMSQHPEAAVPASNALRGMVPDSGHLQHMPSHIDVLVGAYGQALQANIDASAVDKKYLDRNGMGGMCTLYAIHNIMSWIFAAMMAGNLRSSLAGCDRLDQVTTESFLRTEDPPWADWAEAGVSMRYHVLIRFGQWDTILQLPLPHDQALYTVTTSTAHYAKALAHAVQRNLADADRERDRFLASLANISPTRAHFPNKSRVVFQVARAMIDGELAYRRGNFDQAYEHLDHAVKLDDELLYAEPPSWMLPARHPAAALLLEQGHVSRAAAYFAQDLGLHVEEPGFVPLLRPRQHPLNPWALSGYYECLLKLGRLDEANEVKKQLDKATQGADVDIRTSCFCAIGKEQTGGQSCC